MEKVNKILLLAAMLFMLPVVAHAQSLSYAQYLLDQGKYLEAAKELRPLADGGNAEAQYLAAKLFFDGKGVKQSDTQGFRYLTMAADQGNEDAVQLLLLMTDREKWFVVADKYCTKFPTLKKKYPGLMMAESYMMGIGVEKDLAKAVALFEMNDLFEYMMKDKNMSLNYWQMKMQVAGKECLEDYADYLYSIKDWNTYNRLRPYILDELYNDGNHGTLAERADQGNGWALAEMANRYMSRGYDKNATIALAKKAKDAGSAYGNELYKKLTYVPFTQNISRTTSSTSTSTDVLKIEQGYDYTTIYFRYHQRGFNDWVATGDKTYIEYNGKKYKLLKSTLPILPNHRTVRPGEAVDYSNTFERIPDSATTFIMVENGDKYGFKIE